MDDAQQSLHQQYMDLREIANGRDQEAALKAWRQLEMLGLAD